jgi:hypothetical protein
MRELLSQHIFRIIIPDQAADHTCHKKTAIISSEMIAARYRYQAWRTHAGRLTGENRFLCKGL